MKDIEGTIIYQVNEAIGFVKRNIKRSAKTIPGKVERVEKWEYPLDAIREAVINTICHRDYSSTGNVQIRIFDDRLEVWNPGHLPSSLNIADLAKEHNSIPQNKLIAQAFYLIGYIEKWGTGTLKMIEACREYGLPNPEFYQEKGTFKVTLYNLPTKEYLKKLGLNERQITALGYINKRGKITNKEYAEQYNVSRQTATRDLTDLVKKNLIKQIGAGKATYYESIMSQL